MNITRQNITPFLDAPIPEAKNTVVDAWLSAISATLTKRFGEVLPAMIAPAVYNIVADVIARRLVRGKNGDGGGTIKRQATGPSSVEYNTGLTSLSGWFYPGEANELGELFGNGATLSSIRTPAPDGVRFGNLARSPIESQLGGDSPLYVEDDYEGEYGEGDAS